MQGWTQMKKRASATLVLIVAVAACAPTGRRLSGDNPFTTSTERPNRIRIEVQNLNFADARLFAIRSAGNRISLGTVGGKQDATFDIDWTMNQDLRIEINLLAGPTCTTQTLQVQPGDIIELQIQSVFTQSAFCRSP